MKNFTFICAVLCTSLFCSCNNSLAENDNLKKAEETLARIYELYSIEDSYLLRETYPFDEEHRATYLGNDEQANRKNPNSYLWPYSGSLSAVGVLFQATDDKKYVEMFDTKVLPGLDMYYDVRRSPDAYASYIKTAPLSDRFYDDNVWLGIDFTEMYQHTNNPMYLEKAETVWAFIESGIDSLLGGGIYWVEQNRKSKHACSNAPGAVFALKLFEATADSAFFYKGKNLYEWTKTNLQDPEDFLVYDNMRLDGGVDKKKYSYNSGQLLQAAALMYKHTNEKKYLQDAQEIAKSSYNYFFRDLETETGETVRILKARDIWFDAVMFRGFAELYLLDNNREYIDAFQRTLDYAWSNLRDENGLFAQDRDGKVDKDSPKWLLPQFAMVEMYARISKL